MGVDKLWTEGETAEFLGVSPFTLRKWRCTGEQHIPYVKIGRTPMYRPVDIQAYIESRLQQAGVA